MKRFYTIVLCTGLGSIFRLIYLWFYPVQARDAFTYKEFIEYWCMTGNPPTEHYTPLLGLFFVKETSKLFNYDIMTTGIIVNMVFGLLIIIMLMNIFSTITHSNNGLICFGLITATHPTLIYFSSQMLRENSFLFFYSLCILHITKYFKSSRRFFIAIAAFAASAAFMCRYEALELCFFICFAVLLKKTLGILDKSFHIVLFTLCFTVSFFILSYAIGSPFKFPESVHFETIYED